MITSARMLNDILYRFYLGKWQAIEELLSEDKDISWPQLVHVPEAYTWAQKRIMIVGQQAKEWCFDLDKNCREDLGEAPIDSLLKTYNYFKLGREYFKSPYWLAAHSLSELLNPGQPKGAFIWSNILKIDRHNGLPKRETIDKLLELKLLPEEIRVTQPEIVVFFTGPDYDELIKKSFPGIEINHLTKLTAQLYHPGLPANSFRTYHPNYLKLKNQWDQIELIAALAGEG